MRINNNIMAKNTHRQYGIAINGLSTSAEKLASGYRINRAADDAAGLAISEKMRAQIRGLNMASKNCQDGISLLQTAEGGLQESHNILQRMRELSVQAASDTNENTIDRAALDAEFQQLKGELDNVATTTRFNGMNVLDGTFSGRSYMLIAGMDLSAANMDNILDIQIFEAESSNNMPLSSLCVGVYSNISIPVGLGITIHENNTNMGRGKEVYLRDMGAGSYDVVLNSRSGFAVALKLKDLVAADCDYPQSEDYIGRIVFETANIEGRTLSLQTGANTGDSLDINIKRMCASSLGLLSAGVSSRERASSTIEACDKAINKVSSQRAAIGATQNRLQHKVSNLDTSSENLSASESRIRDIDMAKEMSNYTKHNILIQAATSMLAQANQSPQNVLSLIK